METQDANTRSAGAVNHPSAEEWMGYLYEELPPERKRELHAHLAQCGDCGRQVQQWRAGMAALDEWPLPQLPRLQKRAAWQPVTLMQWAAAAAVVLMAGFAIGRQTSSAAGEVAALKSSVAQLAGRIENERAFNASNAVATASTVASEGTMRLLTEYARLDDERRTDDRQKVALALREMDSRLLKLRTELETVAVNTETGFRQTKEGLTTLASYTVAGHGDASDLPKPENRNQ
jgi:hypothetical protein